MDEKTKLNYELVAACAGIGFVILYPIFWFFIAKMQPPLSYNATPAQAAHFYLSKRNDVIFGMAISAVVGGLWIPWTAQLTVAMWRIEGSFPVFTIAQFAGGVLTAWALISGAVMWLAPAFRPNADPQIIQALSDSAYLTFNSTYVISTVQAVAAGAVGLAERSPTPVFPPWVCWIAILAGLSFAIVIASPWVMTGPFALDGWLAAWVPGTMFFLWCSTSTYALLNDILKRKRLSR